MNNTENKEPKSSITPEKLRELKEQALEILSITRQQILVFYPFTGAVSMRLDLVPVRDFRVRTACTDGNTIYFDIDFLSKLNKDERLFVLAHEIWHVVLMHMLRLQNRNQSLFNIATDCEVNSLLKKDGLRAPENLVFPKPEWEGLPAEEIYEHLLNDIKKNAKNQSGKGNKNNKSSSGGEPYNRNADGEPCKGDSPLTGQFDDHQYEGKDEEQGSGSGNPTDQWGEVGEDPEYHPAINKDLAEKIRESVVSAAQQVERSQGTLPDHIKRLVDGIAKPEIRWQEVLAQFVSQTFSSGERTWLPPNRRYVWQGVYLPSVYDNKINVTVVIDTSGSTSGDLPKFFTELKSLMDSFGGYTIRIIQCDAAVDSCEEYDSDNNPFEYELKNFEFSGGGGTSFCPPFDYIKKNGLETDALIYLTDGYGDAPQYPPEYPVLWILTNDGNDTFCDWGRKIKFEKRSTTNDTW